MSRKRKKKRNYLLFMILLLMPFVYGDVFYNSTGGEDQYFQTGNSLITDNRDASGRILNYVDGLSDPRGTAVVSDLDDDGVVEIIAQDGDSFNIYHGINLLLNNSISLGLTANEISNFITFDIDGDGLREIIVAGEYDEELHILEFNGVSFTSQNVINLNTLTNHDQNTDAGQIAIQCRDVDDCIMFYTRSKKQVSSGVNYVMAAGFNSTNIHTGTIIDTTGSTLRIPCFPNIRSIALADYDGDGTIEYVFNSMETVSGATHEDIMLWYVNVNPSTLVASLEETYTETAPEDIAGTSIECDVNNAGHLFTPPLVFDIRAGNQLETVMAFQISADEFKMYSYDYDGADIDEYDKYPGVFESDGTIVSNIFKGNFFEGTKDDNDDSFCVLGYDQVDEDLTALCASEKENYQFILFYDSAEFRFETEGLWNVTTDYDRVNAIGHAIENDQSNNIDEVLTPYGIFELDWDDSSCGQTQVPPIRCLTQNYENPLSDAAMIAVDYEQDTFHDLIGLSSDNIMYIDDTFVNTAPRMPSRYYTNPCINSIWKVNTSFELRASPIDDDNDNIRMKAHLYYGDSNEMCYPEDCDWDSYLPSEATHNFIFTSVNKTITNGVLKIYAQDNSDDLNNVSDEKTFNVANQGIVFGECIESEILPEEEEEDEEPTISDLEETTLTDNRIRDAAIDIANLAGVPLIILILLIMLGIDLVVIMALWQVPYVGLFVALFANFFIVLIAALMGMIGTAILISLFAIILIAGGFFVTWSFNKTTGGGG